jgi:two-component system, NarL family, sensor histidine kinase UhpB
MLNPEMPSVGGPPAMQVATKRILVVDDDPDILSVYSRLLSRSGYEVWTASTGLEGLQVAREKHPDMALLDVMLPDLSGIEVCRQIKADASLQDVFVVLNSGGATNAANTVDGLEMGADEYLTKPMEASEFLARIRTLARLRDTTVALRASEQHYRKLVEILPDAVCLIELNGKLLTVNPQAATMLGYGSATEVLEQNLFDLMQPEDRHRFQAETTRLRQSRTSFSAEYTMLRKGGTPFPVELSAVMLKESQDESLQLAVVVRDLTLRKQTEAQSRQLPELINEAQEAERYRVARELHDGVNQLIAAAKMRLCKVANLPGPLSSAAREMLARCEKQLVQVLEENRRIARDLRPNDLDELGLVEACSNFCQEVQRRTNLTVECQLAGLAGLGERLPPNVELNLFRIVQEAISNAEKHARAKTIRLSMVLEDHDLTLVIQDDGCGFDLKASRSAKANGHGFGLTNMRERVTSLGGTCQIDSGPGQGTTITVRVDLRTFCTAA